MAYEGAATLVATETVNGRKHVYYSILEEGGGASDGCLIPAPSKFCTVTLVEWTLTTPGTTNTFAPGLGVGTAVNQYVAGKNGPTTDTPAATGRNPTNQHMVVPEGSSIIWRGGADTGTFTQADSLICIVEGHI